MKLQYFIQGKEKKKKNDGNTVCTWKFTPGRSIITVNRCASRDVLLHLTC